MTYFCNSARMDIMTPEGILKTNANKNCNVSYFIELLIAVEDILKMLLLLTFLHCLTDTIYQRIYLFICCLKT